MSAILHAKILPAEAAFISGHTKENRTRRCNNQSWYEEGPPSNKIVVEDYRFGFPLPQLPDHRIQPRGTSRLQRASLDRYGGLCSIQDSIKEILSGNGIKWCDRTCVEFSEEEYPSRPRFFIQVFAERPVFQTETWIRATEQVLQHFENRDIDTNEWGFYLMDVMGPGYRWSQAVPVSNPACKIWGQVSDLLIQDILYPKVDWSTLDLVVRGQPGGYPDDLDCLTVVLQVSPTSEKDWFAVARRMEYVLTQIDEFQNVAIEIIRDVPVGFTGFHRAHDPYLEAWKEHGFRRSVIPEGDMWDEQLFVGQSVSSAQDHGKSGSVTCIIRLTFRDGIKEFYALTNFHVAVGFPSIMDMDEMNVDADLKNVIQHGLTSTQAPIFASQFKVEAPSRADFEEIIESSQWRVRDLTRRIEHLGDVFATWQDSKPTHVLSEHDHNDLKRYTDEIRAANLRLSKHVKPELGSVYAASGLRKDENSMLLDWALIPVGKERLPGYMKIPQEEGRWKATSYAVGDQSPLPELRPQDKNLKVHQFGRASGYTKGLVNGATQIYLRSWQRGVNGNVVFDLTKSHVMVPDWDECGPLPNRFRLPQPGDSGGPVYASSEVGSWSSMGNFVGLHVGGSEAGRLDHHRFIDRETLYKDIKKMTGAVDVHIATQDELYEAKHGFLPPWRTK